MTIRHKTLLKCECGRTVSKGSVFCPHCRAAINLKNAKVMKREERSYQKKTRNQGRKA